MVLASRRSWSRCWQVCFPLRSLHVSCSQCPHVAFSLWVYILHVSLCIQISSSYKDTRQIGLGTFQQTHFNLITSRRPHLQIQSHFEVPGVRSLTYEFGRDKFSLTRWLHVFLRTTNMHNQKWTPTPGNKCRGRIEIKLKCTKIHSKRKKNGLVKEKHFPKELNLCQIISSQW